MSDGLVLFTFLHVLVSVVGIASGAVVVVGFLYRRRWESLITLFLAATLATSLTGFLFPFDRLMPSHVVGALSVGVLAWAYAIRGRSSLRARRTFVACALTALYLNVFVLVAQAFMKIPALQAIAPTQTELPFLVTQAVVLIMFIWLGVSSVRGVGKGGAGSKGK
jgi:hypothetical protein